MHQARVQCAIWRAMRLAGVRVDTPGAKEVVSSLAWIVSQQPTILQRFPIAQNDAHTLEGIDLDSYWSLKCNKFLFRADKLTLESPEGRLVIAELAATSVGLLASCWRVYGPPVNGSPTKKVKIE